MTRQHFNAIAAVIARYYTEAEDQDQRKLVSDIARELSITLCQFNPNFNRARFLAACRGE